MFFPFSQSSDACMKMEKHMKMSDSLLCRTGRKEESQDSVKIRKVQAKSEVKVEKSMMFINVSEKYLKSSILD